MSETFKAKCKRLGVNYHRALKRRQARMSEEKIFDTGYLNTDRESNEIEVYGVKYKSLRQAIIKLNPVASTSSIVRMLNAGYTSEEAFEYVPNPGYSNGIIYLVTNKITGKEYVGQTVQTLDKRWQKHVDDSKSNAIASDQSLHSAMREYGIDNFYIDEIDSGITLIDLENKENFYIEKLNTLVPNGYNILLGGGSGGSNKKPKEIDGILFESVKAAVKHVAETRNISIIAAERRVKVGKIDIEEKRSKSGNKKDHQHTKLFRAWQKIVYRSTNPNSKFYIDGLDVYEPWKDFNIFKEDVGKEEAGHLVFARLDKNKGFYPDNCRWMTQSESSKINIKHMKKNGMLKKGKQLGLF